MCGALAIAALVQDTPSVLMLLFFATMLVHEVLNLLVERSFYKHYLPPKRRRVSNALLAVLCLLGYGGLVGLSAANVGLKGTNFTGLF